MRLTTSRGNWNSPGTGLPLAVCREIPCKHARERSLDQGPPQGIRIDYVTHYDCFIAMKTVQIAELKARLSEHLRHVRRGHVLTVLDRVTPIAQVVPYSEAADSLRVRHPLGKSSTRQDVALPRQMRLDFDIVDLLMEERQGNR